MRSEGKVSLVHCLFTCVVLCDTVYRASIYIVIIQHLRNLSKLTLYFISIVSNIVISLSFDNLST